MLEFIVGLLVLLLPFMVPFFVHFLVSPFKKKGEQPGHILWLFLTLLLGILDFVSIIFVIGCFSSRKAIPALVLFFPLCLLFLWLTRLCERRWRGENRSASGTYAGGETMIRCHSCGGMNKIVSGTKSAQCKYCFARLKKRNQT